MTDKDISELKRSRPHGPGWEWANADSHDGTFRWRFHDTSRNRICFVNFDQGKWSAQVRDEAEKKVLYDVTFTGREEMRAWGYEHSALKIRRELQMGHKYYARPIETIKNSPGCWDSYKIGVFRRNEDGDELIGDYKRNYSFLDTFHWFTKDGKDYALYSPDYTATRIMELPSCKDLGGEERDSVGFCPVEFYVPSYVDRALVDKDPKFDGAKYRVYEPSEAEINERDGSKALTGLVHEAFGFVGGCVWGDDTSWKAQYLDLSQADKGIVKRDDRFGYVEIPKNLILREAVDMGDGNCRIRIAQDFYYDIKTGARYDSEMSRVKEILLRSGLKMHIDGNVNAEASLPLSIKGEDYQMLLDLLKGVE